MARPHGTLSVGWHYASGVHLTQNRRSTMFSRWWRKSHAHIFKCCFTYMSMRFPSSPWEHCRPSTLGQVDAWRIMPADGQGPMGLSQGYRVNKDSRWSPRLPKETQSYVPKRHPLPRAPIITPVRTNHCPPNKWGQSRGTTTHTSTQPGGFETQEIRVFEVFTLPPYGPALPPITPLSLSRSQTYNGHDSSNPQIT